MCPMLVLIFLLKGGLYQSTLTYKNIFKFHVMVNDMLALTVITV